jgi:cyclopropane fatty-acyl-phospholipid synthase-like methyltransferase
MGITTYIYSQFGKPRGLLGRVAGYIMATRPSNIERNDWTLSLLQIGPTDRVLEIGFGPGIAAGKAAAQAAEVVGVDRSALMVQQATVRNRELIKQGKLKLALSSADAPDAGLGAFDKIYSVNVVQFWKEPVQVFRKLRTMLRPGGVVATAFMPRHRGATNEDAFAKGKQIETWLREAGFAQIDTQTKMMKPVAVVAVVARVG